MARAFFGRVLLACGAIWGWEGNDAAAATLDIDLDIRTRVEAVSQGVPGRSQQDVVILVMDRSGSMTNYAPRILGRPNETRETVMREMLRNRLEMLSVARPNAEVWTVLFANEISPFYGPYSPKDEKGVFEHLGEPMGCTLLYDAMERAVLFGEERMKRDPTARIWLYFYSDGENYYEPGYTYWEEMREETLPDGRTKSKLCQVPIHYVGANAVKQFKKDYEARIQAYADVGKMSLETGCWLGEGNPPVMIENKRKDAYPLELTADGTSLKNPATSPSQGLKARLLVPLPARYVKDLEKLEATLVFDGQGKREVKQFPLAPGKKTVRLVLPDGLPTTAFNGHLQVKGLPDVWQSLALAEPDPVELSFAEPGALALSGMTPRGERWVAVGVPVEFSAMATEGAEVTWTIDGKDAGKGPFEKVFDRPGKHQAVATAQKAGFRPASAECTIHAVDTSVQVVAPAGARVGEKVAFEAKAAAGESVSWWVDGQAAGSKDARLDCWTFDTSGHHTAKARVYFGHGLSGEGEAHFEVSVAPHVAIDIPWSGAEFAFGEEFKAVAKVEGDFDRVAWSLRGPEEATNEAEVDHETRMTHPAAFKPGKGGAYELTAVAEGLAGRLESQPVRFSVAREDAWVRIDEPASGAGILTGTDLVLKASARGEEAKEICWTVKDPGGNVLFLATRPTEGGVSQCSFAVPETLGNGTTLFVSAEAAGDPALRAENDVETRCANCTEMGAVLSLSHGGDERRNFGRGEKIVAELKDLRGDVRDIEWTFGEDGRGAGRVVEWHGWTDYNVYPVRATGRCGKCGAAHDFGPESVIVERRPLTASFSIAERGSYYTAGGKLHLTSTSEGDIDNFIWMVDGVELADFRGKPEAVVELPFKPCDMVLALTVSESQEGESATTERDVRIRYGWWAAVMFLLAGLLLACLLGWLFLRNSPRGWRYKTWLGDGPILDEEDLGKTQGVSRRNKAVQFGGDVIGGKWSIWKKRAFIPLIKGKKGKDDPVVAIGADSENGPMLDTNSSRNAIPVNRNGVIAGQAKKVWVFLISRKGETEYRRLAIADPPRELGAILVSHFYTILFFLSLALILWGVFWASVQYAI